MEPVDADHLFDFCCHRLLHGESHEPTFPPAMCPLALPAYHCIWIAAACCTVSLTATAGVDYVRRPKGQYPTIPDLTSTYNQYLYLSTYPCSLPFGHRTTARLSCHVVSPPPPPTTPPPPPSCSTSSSSSSSSSPS